MKYKGLQFKQVDASKDKLSDPIIIDKTYFHWRWRMFIGMYLGYTLFYFTRKNITPALPLISEKMDISLVELGILSSVFYVVYGLGKFISGILADRANIRTFMALGLFAASAIHLFLGYLNSLYLLMFFWGLNGVFQSMGFPPIAKGLVHWFSANERATKWTLLSSSHTAGTFGIGVIVASIIGLYRKGIVGWEAVFYVPGILGIIGSISLLYILRDRPVSLGLPPIEDYKKVQNVTIKNVEQKSDYSLLSKYVFKNPYLWVLGLANTCVYIIRFGTLDWATTFMHDVKGIDEIKVAMLWTLMPLAGIPGGICAGYLADRFWNGRCVPINLIYLFLLALSIYGFYIFSGPESYGLTAFYLLAIGFLIDGPQNLISGVQVSRVTVVEAMATANGFIGLFGYFGATISGIGLAYVISIYSWGGMYAVCIICCLVTMVLIFSTRSKEKRIDN